MKVDERFDNPRPWKKCVLLPRSSAVMGQISHHWAYTGVHNAAKDLPTPHAHPWTCTSPSHLQNLPLEALCNTVVGICVKWS